MTAEAVVTYISIAGSAWVAGLGFVRLVVRPCRRGIEKVRGAIATIDETKAQVNTMHEELGPNGGKSLGALVRKTYGMGRVMEARMDLVMNLMDRPLFECAPDGQNVRINEAFTKQFGWSPAEMAAWRWVRILHADDRESYMDEWKLAVKDRRVFQTIAQYLTRSGVLIHVRVTVEPNFDESTGDVVRWLGRVETLGSEPLPAKGQPS